MKPLLSSRVNLNAISNKNILIIHNSPSSYLLDSLLSIRSNIIIASNLNLKYSHPSIKVIQTDIFNLKELAEAISEYHYLHPIDCVLPVWDGSVIATSLIANLLNLPGNPEAASVLSRNKYAMALRLHKYNIPHPRSEFYDLSSSVLPNLLDLRMQYPVIVKNPYSTNSQAVIKTDNEEQLSDAISSISKIFNTNIVEGNRLQSLYASEKKGVLLQEYVFGKELNIDLVYLNDQFEVLSVFEKAPMNGPYFAEIQSVHPTSLTASQLENCINVAKRAIVAMGGKIGAAHVEIRYHENIPVIIDIGLRPGGFYTPQATEIVLGENVFYLLLDLFLNNKIHTVSNTNQVACLYGAINISSKGVIKSIAGVDIFKKYSSVMDYKLLKNAGDHVAVLPESSDYHIGQFLLKGSNREELENVAIAIRKNILIDLDTNV